MDKRNSNVDKISGMATNERRKTTREAVKKLIAELQALHTMPCATKYRDDAQERAGKQAVQALVKIGPAAVPALIQALTRVSELRWLLGKESLTYFQVNEAAAVMLGKRGDQRAVPALTEVLQDKALYFLLRHNAAEALEALGNPQAVPTLIHAPRNEGVYHEGIVPKSTVPEAVEAQVRDTQAVLSLVQVLQDKTCGEWEQKKAFKALGATQSPQAVAALVEFLNDQDAECWVERNAVAALQAIGTPQAVLALIEVLASEHTHGATHALRKIGTPTVPALLEAFKHPSREVRFCVVKALGLIKDPQAVPALIEALTDEDGDWLVRCNAAEALGLIGSLQAVPTLIEVLNNSNPYLVHKEVTKALREIMRHYSDRGLRAALPPLRRLRKHDPIFREVLEQIEAITATHKDLPLPAAAPPLDVTTLPRSADASPDASMPPPPGG